MPLADEGTRHDNHDCDSSALRPITANCLHVILGNVKLPDEPERVLGLYITDPP